MRLHLATRQLFRDGQLAEPVLDKLNWSYREIENRGWLRRGNRPENIKQKLHGARRFSHCLSSMLFGTRCHFSTWNLCFVPDCQHNVGCFPQSGPDHGRGQPAQLSIYDTCMKLTSTASNRISANLDHDSAVALGYTAPLILLCLEWSTHLYVYFLLISLAIPIPT